MALRIHTTAERLVVTLPARVDHRNAPALLDHLMRILSVPDDVPDVLLDLTATTSIDAAGTDMLAAVSRGARLLGLRLFAHTDHDSVRRAARAANVPELAPTWLAAEAPASPLHGGVDGVA